MIFTNAHLLGRVGESLTLEHVFADVHISIYIYTHIYIDEHQ